MRFVRPFQCSSHLYTSAPYLRRLTWLAFDFSFPLSCYYIISHVGGACQGLVDVNTSAP
nr:MAG TPA: hypothetical protein [Caudoviricetes sp.]